MRIEPWLAAWDLAPEGAAWTTPSGTLLFVRRGDERLVLKIPRPESDEHVGALALRHFDGRGAVRAIAEKDGALLMERAMPGRALTERVLAGHDDETTEVLCDVAARLHQAGRPSYGAPAVEDWGQGFARFRQGQGSGIEPGLLDRAERLFRELAASQGPSCLLHGDLHHDNMVNDAHRGWLAIDPKGVVGEPVYEFGALLRNPTPDTRRFADAAILDRRATILAERGGHDRDRLLAWAFAQGVLSAIWSWEDGQPDDRGLVTSRAVLPLL